MDAVRLRARVLLRSHWRATVVLGVVVGLASAIPMIAWEATRRTEAAYPSFVDAADLPATLVAVPPPGAVDPSSPGGQVALQAMQAEARGRIAGLPEVDRVVRVAGVVGTLTRPDGAGEPAFGVFQVLVDPGGARRGGLLLDGRWPDESAPGEILLGERNLASSPDLHVGSTLRLTPFLAGQSGCASENLCPPAGTPQDVTVVGIVRQPQDLAAADPSAGGADAYLGPAFWAANPGLFTYGVLNAVWARPGVSDDELRAALDATWPDRELFYEKTLTPDIASVFDAIGYETRAGTAFALVVGFAVLVFVGQAVVRQGTIEAADGPALAAVGARRRELMAAAALRGSVTAGIAAVVAAVATVAGSAVAPFGLARRTVRSPSLHADATVLGLGLLAVTVLVVALTALPARVVRPAGRPLASRARRLPGLVARVWPSPPAMSGASAPWHGREAVAGGSALAGAALAVLALTAAGVAVASFDHLVATPADYGVAWDEFVGNIASPEAEAEAAARLATVPGIAAAAGVYSAGASVAGTPVPLLGSSAVGGLRRLPLVVTSGRSPSGPEEIALGAETMRHLGVGVGDTVELDLETQSPTTVSALVVGQAVLSAWSETTPGVGGVVDPTWIRPLAGGEAQAFAVRIDPTAERAQVEAALEEIFPGAVRASPAPTAVRNLGRVRALPWLLAVTVAGLAAAAVLHAIALSARARRREFGVLRGLGFQGRQVTRSVCWQAGFLAAGAACVGVPLGVALGRAGWRLLAGGIGVRVVAVVPVPFVVAVGVSVVAGAVALALLPGYRASRVPVREALRSE